MTCCEPALEAVVVPEGAGRLSALDDHVTLGEVGVIELGGRSHLVARVAPNGPRGLWQALAKVGALGVVDARSDDGALEGLHLDPRVNDAHLGFLATI